MIFTRYGLPCVFECPECRHIECWEEVVESGLPGSIQEARKRNNKKNIQITITPHTHPRWTPILIPSLSLIRCVCTCLVFTGICPLWPGHPYAEG